MYNTDAHYIYLYDINNDYKDETNRLLFIRNFTLAADITENPTHAISLFRMLQRNLLVAGR